MDVKFSAKEKKEFIRWMTKELEPIFDGDPATLADYGKHVSLIPA